jgi:hypothetical protein
MARQKKDLTSATYLDGLGRESARQYAPSIREDAARFGAKLPLDQPNAEALLQNTITGLQRSRLLDWSSTSSDRQYVFINSWLTEMQHLGIVD